jgi:translation elongation factor P/translation initiation factor 5A
MYSASDLKPGKKFMMDWQPYEGISYAQKVMGRW